MKPEIVERNDILVAGLVDSFSMHDKSKIFELWDKFPERVSELKISDTRTYGIVLMHLPTHQLKPGHDKFYMTAAPVEPETELPPDMVQLTLAGGPYAKFTHHGPVSQFEKTLVGICAWQPEAPYTMRRAPMYEEYDQRFKFEEAESVFDVYVPLEKL